MRFGIDSIEKFVLRVPKGFPFTIITGTPIIIRVPRVKYKIYGIKPNRNYDYIYWRNGYPNDLFVSQVENNLLKKFVEYLHEINPQTVNNTKDIDTPIRSSFSLLHKFKFIKQVSTRIFMKGFEQVVIGTIWEFGFNVGADKDIIEFSLDAGLGERNSLGFGFMNLINK
jgi:CRISPR-associated endoribonuclease Cas6